MKVLHFHVKIIKPGNLLVELLINEFKYKCESFNMIKYIHNQYNFDIEKLSTSF
jgi:hypothetical protein